MRPLDSRPPAPPGIRRDPYETASARNLRRALAHPALHSAREDAWDAESRRLYVTAALAARADAGVKVWVDSYWTPRLESIWTRLAEQAERQGFRLRRRVFWERGAVRPNAQAWPTGAIAVERRYIPLARGVAEALSRPDTAEGAHPIEQAVARVTERAAQGVSLFESDDRAFAPIRGAATEHLADSVIAGVVAHEMAHVIRQDYRRSPLVGGASAGGLADAAMPYLGRRLSDAAVLKGAAALQSQQREFEADRLGLRLAVDAGFDPEALLAEIAVSSALHPGPVRPELSATHPPGWMRIEAARQVLCLSTWRGCCFPSGARARPLDGFSRNYFSASPKAVIVAGSGIARLWIALVCVLMGCQVDVGATDRSAVFVDAESGAGSKRAIMDAGASRGRPKDRPGDDDRADAGTAMDGGVLSADASQEVAPTYDWPERFPVLVINFDPRFGRDQSFRERMGWQDPRQLVEAYRASLFEISGGKLRYEIARWVEVDDAPLWQGESRYTEAEYRDCLRDERACRTPDRADYRQLIDDYGLCEAVASGVREVWLFGGPYFGFAESKMVGPDAFFVNSKELRDRCAQNFMIMGFNYERPMGQMLHSFGHRVEDLLGAKLGRAWSLFMNGARGSEVAGCGNVHFPPNGAGEYVYDSASSRPSSCRRFETGDPAPESVTCALWGCTHDGYMSWWLGRLPRGGQGVVRDGWWPWVADLDRPGFRCGQLSGGAACEEYSWLCETSACTGRCVLSESEAPGVCDDPNGCRRHASAGECDAHGSSEDCAWYFCAQTCFPRGTPREVACGAN